MIFLWIKIGWYKIVKQIKYAISAYDDMYRHLKNRALPGTETGVSRAHAGLRVRVRGNGNITAGGDLVVPGADIQDEIFPARMNTARLNELIGKGLVHAPDGQGDLQRVDLFEAVDHWSAWTDEPGPADTGVEGRAMALAQNETMAVRPSNEIVKCGVCGHPQHPSNVFWCHDSVPSGDPSGGIEPCRCDGTRILGEDGPS